MRLVTADEMRQIDRYAIDTVGIPSLVLMENAGASAARVAIEELDGFQRAFVICGRGNNGGDGLVAARHLWEEGKHVEVFIVGDGELSHDAEIFLRPVEKLGIPVKRVTAPPAELQQSAGQLIVDALLGTGFSGEVREPVASVIDAISSAREGGARVLAVDVPSGLDASTGQVSRHCVKADVTVTFQFMKVGLATYPGAAYAGRVKVCAIGIPDVALDFGKRYQLVDRDVIRQWLSPRDPFAHKGSAGRVVVLAGSEGFTGAALLSARGALRAGAGLVSLGVPGKVYPVVAPVSPETMVIPIGDQARFGLKDVEDAAKLCSNARAVAMGPGLGTSGETPAFVRELLERVATPVVLDADALNCLGGDLSPLRRRSERGWQTVVTPHPGEMARLCGVSPAEIQASRIEWAWKLAGVGVVCVLKGARTVICYGGDCFINPSGNGSMAAPGMGDVLTGVIASFIAQGMGVLAAAVVGTYLHGLAAESLALDRGIFASQVADGIPATLSRVLAVR
ncbi:MAG TPA: NAD(P)H-hydrate dehydratase [Firmicutes bacterium]|nr:NAD(P)H-hydrate dehydratase [Bacillota bacterium]